MSARWLQALPDPDAAARGAADFIAVRLRAAVSARGRFRLAVSGGSTPVPMFEALAARSLPWAQVEIYQVDERVAPRGVPERNLTIIEAAFGRTGATIVAMPIESGDLTDAAARYEEALPDVFDLVHLGLGLDGDTASLFPGDPVLDIVDRDVALCGPYRGSSRMSLTYRGLSKATEVLWLVTGSTKAASLARLWADDRGIPAARVAYERARFVTDYAALGVVRTIRPPGAHPPSSSIDRDELTGTAHFQAAPVGGEPMSPAQCPVVDDTARNAEGAHVAGPERVGVASRNHDADQLPAGGTDRVTAPFDEALPRCRGFQDLPNRALVDFARMRVTSDAGRPRSTRTLLPRGGPWQQGRE